MVGSFSPAFLVFADQTSRRDNAPQLVAAVRVKMGCFFSKKSKRKSDKEDLTQTTTTVDTTTTGNAVPLGNNTDEAPKQYSWDKREKVTTSSLRQEIHTERTGRCWLELLTLVSCLAQQPLTGALTGFQVAGSPSPQFANFLYTANLQLHEHLGIFKWDIIRWKLPCAVWVHLGVRDPPASTCNVH